MYIKRIILVFAWCLFGIVVAGQAITNEQQAADHSLQLYNEKKWKELLVYGKTTLAGGTDFPLLRMRTGYAAFVLGNYSESLKHYEKVYRDDPENNIALYYAYLDNVYLNNSAGARYYAGKLPEETRTAEKIKKNKAASLNLEYSNKTTDLADRSNANYGRVGLTMLLGRGNALRWRCVVP